MTIPSQKQVRVWQGLVLAASVPVMMYGFSSGPPIARTGALVDGGLNCTACHRTFAPANSGSGRVSVSTVSYTPGVKQTITVMVEDPDAQRWGFQLTARLRSDENKEAGTFSVTDGMRVRCAPDGRAAPCDGDKEFAEHVAAGTQLGTRGHGMFTVEWTPPAQDVGEVIFYAAGNAANGDGTNNGDHIYTTSKVLRPACNVTQKPSVTGVSDAASFRAAIAPGGMISIFGGPFSSSDGFFRAASSDLDAGKVPTEFGCVEVEIGGLKAPVFFVSKNQINAQAPLLNVTGPVEVSVSLNSGGQSMRSDAAKVAVSFTAPAFFTFDGKRVAALNVSRDNAVLAGDNAAKPGDIVSVYGTGFGLTNPVWQPGEFPDVQSPLRDPPIVTVGGITLASGDVLYAGASADAPGLYQLNLRLPATLPDGDAAVVARMGGQETQPGTVLAVRR